MAESFLVGESERAAVLWCGPSCRRPAAPAAVQPPDELADDDGWELGHSRHLRGPVGRGAQTLVVGPLQ